MECSVIIVTYNSADDIGTCVDSVLDQSFEKEYDVLVVDNDSTDDTCDVVRRRYADEPRVTLVELDRNYGAAGGKNAALEYTDADYIAYLDPDAIVHKHWLRSLYAHVESFAVAAAHSCIFEPYHAEFGALDREGYPARRVVFEVTSLGYVDDRYTPPVPMETLHLPGGAMLIERSAIDELDALFDETVPFPNEDMDLGFRLNSMGKTVLFVPDAIVYHNQHQKSRITDPYATLRKYFSLIEGRSNVLYKHMSTSEYVRFLPRMYLGYVLNVRVTRTSGAVKALLYPVAAVLGVLALLKSVSSNSAHSRERDRILDAQKRSIYAKLVG